MFLLNFVSIFNDFHKHTHKQRTKKSQIIINNHYNLDVVALRSNAWNCVYLELLVVFFLLLLFIQVFYVYVFTSFYLVLLLTENIYMASAGVWKWLKCHPKMKIGIFNIIFLFSFWFYILLLQLNFPLLSIRCGCFFSVKLDFIVWCAMCSSGVFLALFLF